MNKKVIVGSFLVLALALTGCSSANKSTSSSSVSVVTNAIVAQNFAFSPSSTTVSVGSKVTITNNDSSPHRPISDDNSFDFGQIARGQSASHTFSSAGTFSYHCSIHPEMTGTIIVQ